MKYIIKNLVSLIRNEKFIFIIMLLCAVASALISNFAYGMYYNYSTMKTETEIELNDITPGIIDGETLTKGELQRYAEALSNDTLNQMYVIYAAASLEEFPSESCGSMYMRFVIHDGMYGVCEVTKTAYESQGLLTSGRYIENEEEAVGKNVAIVSGTEGNWTKESKALETDEAHIMLFGKEYEVIGTYQAGGSCPIVPFLSIPDELKLTGIGMSFDRNISRSVYNELLRTAEEMIPGKLSFPDLQFPDSDAIAIYNNMIGIAAVIVIFTMVNFAMLYHYVLEKRYKSLAIMKLCGCRVWQSLLIYIGECFYITGPGYWIGAGLNWLIVNRLPESNFEFIREGYSLEIVLILFAVYSFTSAAILFALILRTTKKTIMQIWRN
ncbi:MAG: hypothetical protein IJ496_08050 [Ruminococcus sp.]|nr:hypothetical protein [Ruminococcus sp.]